MAKSDVRVAPRLARALSDAAGPIADEDELTDTVFTGDLVTDDVDLVKLIGCRLEGVRLTGSVLRKWRLVDCLVVDSDLSGVLLDGCSFTRVEIRDSRLSGFQGAGCHFTDVGFVGCRLDGANFRMSQWERGVFDRCDLTDADFGSSRLPGTRLRSCDLSGVELSKCDLTGASLQGSTLDRLQGAESLRGVTIGSDQIVPAGLALFGAMQITVDDEDDDLGS